MDPVSPSALAGLIAQSAAGEAGKSTWGGLVALVRRALGNGKEVAKAVDKVKAGEPSEALGLAEQLMRAITVDAGLARQIQDWMAETRLTIHDGTVTNAVGGSARIDGHVVQARDVTNVNIGGGH